MVLTIECSLDLTDSTISRSIFTSGAGFADFVTCRLDSTVSGKTKNTNTQKGSQYSPWGLKTGADIVEGINIG